MSGNTSDPAGLVCIWNAHLPHKPEFVFTCQSNVMSACFSPFHPSLVVGGLYSGQIVLWDKRARSTPVQRSTLSVLHSHPIYCLKVIGSQNANSLISCSSDGAMSSWNLDMLTEPQVCIHV